MMGNQGHCADGYRTLCEYIWAGAIGDVLETHSNFAHQLDYFPIFPGIVVELVA